MKRIRTRTKVILIIVIILAILGAIAYKLADRYLIEHVEVVVTNDAGEEAASGSGTGPETQSGSNSDTGSEADSDPGQVTSDDWNYSSDTQTISIKKVQTGSGSDTITYYVADVVLKDASSLLTAFAKDSFGTNITQDTSTIAENHDAIFAINGDYYGFRDTGVVIRNGELYRDEPERDGFATLADGTMMSYNEEEVSSSELLAEGVTNTFSFGPVLVKDGAIAGDFSKVKIDTNFGNRTIQNANPRTGIGMIAPNHYVFVVVDGRSSGYSRGMTLDEFAQLFVDLGATEAYNLDGGGSSTMYFMGRVVNEPLGKGNERGVSDIIYLKE
ncbi:phosphodiester glycosidase family protein [Cohnella fermenti]|uniref:Phosphodiester glycosidase family protein n=1 Tax=Cohnella fermenti TaxID=2565925 RepID=A0A4S4BLT2_9BACL|nr:phosphodiester glycosidase family protein [Cohnella fermenti]THF75748.1 phosphodiester glycosidase family protein [Cohnella fermenti]